jgi:hypothetical protein
MDSGTYHSRYGGKNVFVNYYMSNMILYVY